MKKAFVITSAIDYNKDAPLTYSTVRSVFDANERFRQTVFTVASLDTASPDETTMFLVDISDNPNNWRGPISYQKNLIFVSVKDEFPDIFETVRNHHNKSYCESLILIRFFEKYESALKEFDYIFKVSGRYFTDSSFDTKIFTEENTDKIFFKKPLVFEWNDNWKYSLVDRRTEDGDNKIRQYSSILYGFGKMHFHKFLDMYRVIAVFTNHPEYTKYDVETLLYFFTRPIKNHILETDWIVYGWFGANGTFLRY